MFVIFKKINILYRAAMLQISYNFLCAIQTTIATFAVAIMEVPPGFEPGNKSFADFCLTAWRWYQIGMFAMSQPTLCQISLWSGRRDSNPRPLRKHYIFAYFAIRKSCALTSRFSSPLKILRFSRNPIRQMSQ